eukprot:XP_002258272.1 SICA antigen [Plasmodium knowlesi strain H]
MGKLRGAKGMFGILMAQWLQGKKDSKQKKGVSKEAELGEIMVNVVREIITDMNSTVNESTAEGMCANAGISESTEKEVCTFIVKNLLDIKGIRGHKCTEGKIEDKMKEFVHCTILNLWSTLYLSNHCNNKNAVNGAYNIMNSRNKRYRGTSVCGRCELGFLEPMKVLKGTASVLGVIYQMMVKDKEVMRLIKGGGSQAQGGCDEHKKILKGLGLPESIPPPLLPPRAPAPPSRGLPTPSSTTTTTTTTTTPVTSSVQPPPTSTPTPLQQTVSTPVTTTTTAATAAQSDPCSPNYQPSQEIKASDKKGDDLRLAWKQYLSSSSQNGQPGQAVTIPVSNEMFQELKSYMNWGNGKGSVPRACSTLSYPGEKGKEDHMKQICRVPVMIVNWMAGLDEQGKEKNGVTRKEEWEQYLRCIVGHSIILRILGNKCDAKKMLEIISDNMKKGGSQGTVPNVNSICSWVKVDDMEKMEQLIGPTVDAWLHGAKQPTGRGGIMGVGNIVEWMKCNDHQKQKEDGQEENCKSDRIIDLLGGGRLGALRKLVDPVARATSCIKDKHSNASNGNLCKYLDCMKHLWMKMDASTQKSKVSVHRNIHIYYHHLIQNNFWTKDVKALWTELSTAMNIDGGNGTKGNGCNQMDDGSATGSAGGTARTATDPEKKACNYLHAGLKTLYEGTSTTGNNGILSKKNPSLRQTMGCFLLHAYAKHMKDKAVCFIDAGIKQAFDSWYQKMSTCNVSGTEPCVPCQWKEEEYKICNITINSSATPAKTAKTKVEGIVNNNDPDTKSIITNINKMEKLCDGLQCIASHLNSSNGQHSNTTADNFWDGTNGEVHKLWQALSQAMKDSNGTGSGNGCNEMDDNGQNRTPTDPEKKACQHLTAGFEKLKQLSESTTSNGKILDKNASLKLAMGCFLLHFYAKKMKNDAKCEIEAGIKKAFEVGGKDLSNNVNCNGGKGQCVSCHWNDATIDDCEITTTGTTPKAKVTDKLTPVQNEMKTTLTTTMKDINKAESLCAKLQCAAPKWFNNNKAGNSGTVNKTWCEFWDKAVKTTLTELFNKIEENGKNNATKTDGPCRGFGDGNEHSVERKACNHITAGLKYISEVQGDAKGVTNNANAEADDKFFKQSMMCAALNLYADRIKKETATSCPIGEETVQRMFVAGNGSNTLSPTSCSGSGGNNNNCFICTREPDFSGCNLLVHKDLIGTSTLPNGQSCTDNATEVKTKMDELLNNEENQSNINTKMKETLTTITKMDNHFCTQLQCAIKQKLKIKNGQATSTGTTSSWSDINSAAENELTNLLKHMTNSDKQSKVTDFCKESNWDNGTKEGKTNKAACLLFASGLQHIYTHGNGRPNGQKKGQFNGPSFEQTMGCLFLKEYAKQLKGLAETKKKTEVHPQCSVNAGIKYAFSKSKDIMKASSKCSNNNSCFVCTEGGYDDCLIGTDNVKQKVEPLLKTKQTHMQQTLANTLCPILPMDLLTPFLPLAPVSIGLSVMAYYLWKYFGPLGKGGPRFRRSPTEIPGPSVQEQVLDHVQQDSSHEYRLVKERKPPSAPTRTKRSGRVNRRTIIEIHFEVLDECQKGDTQLNQKDFLELLVREFMGSEFMEEEQIPKEEVLMESVPMERVPSLGSGFMI